MCHRCGVEVETLAHVLFSCRGMKEVWSESPFFLSGFDLYGSMWSLFQFMRNSLNPELFLVSLVVCWKIWEGRNMEVHGDNHGFPSDIVAWSKAFQESYCSAQVATIVADAPVISTTWIPPDEGMIKINVDVALPERGEEFCTSLVAKTASGECIWWSRQVLMGRPTPTNGDALVVLHGIQEALIRGWRKVVLETVCFLVFNYLNNEHQSLCSFGAAVLDSCLVLRSRFQSLSFSFVRRSGNRIAHTLATSPNISCN